MSEAKLYGGMHGPFRRVGPQLETRQQRMSGTGRAASPELESQRAEEQSIPKSQKKSSSLDWWVEGNVALRSQMKFSSI